VNTAELWALYERENVAANEAYRDRGCPECGDIAVDKTGWIGREHQRCQLHALTGEDAA
jgi:hypothetical protein